MEPEESGHIAVAVQDVRTAKTNDDQGSGIPGEYLLKNRGMSISPFALED